MAHCVISAIVDTDSMDEQTGMIGALIPACVVHTHYAPCPYDGEPANPLALHSLPGLATRAEALRMWHLKTHRQRPLVIHRVDGRGPEEHEGEGIACSCRPEILAPEGAEA